MANKISISNQLVKPVIIALAVLILFAIFTPFGIVGAGERGVLLRFGAVTGKVYNEGLYLKIPLIETVRITDVKIQKDEADVSAASKDLQTVTSKVALNYRVDPSQVAVVYQNIGTNYKIRLIDPFVQEAVKASTAKFTAEELITKRELVREDIKTTLKEKFIETGIVVEEFNIVDFQFSRSFNDAIEAKVTAEQNALAARNKLEQIKFEAEQAIASAKGKAEAQRIEGDALRQSPQVIELRAIEKWDGKLPQYMTGTIPFVNLPSAQ
jgi:regulator of protease activity HflC (stomatin/prohibitin superfamily)